MFRAHLRVHDLLLLKKTATDFQDTKQFFKIFTHVCYSYQNVVYSFLFLVRLTDVHAYLYTVHNLDVYDASGNDLVANIERQLFLEALRH